MSIYETYCREQFDAQGRLSHIDFHWPDNFNFGYDVVDAIAEKDPDKRALVWRGAEGREKTFTFGDIRRLSNQAANVFRQAGIGRGDYVMVALHKLGAVMVPVTHMLTVKDLLYRMDCLTLKGILCTPEGDVAERMREAAGQKAPGCRLWTVQRDIPGFENLSKAVEAAPDPLPRQETSATAPCCCTSPPAPRATPRASSTTSPIPWPTRSRRNTGSRPRRAGSTSPWRRPAGPRPPGARFTASGWWAARSWSLTSTTSTRSN